MSNTQATRRVHPEPNRTHQQTKWGAAVGLILGLGVSLLLPAESTVSADIAPGPTLPATTNPILFVTQVPIPYDFANIASPFANHRGHVRRAPRGGDLWLRLADGALRNLTAEAGYGMDGFQGANAIAVRQPCVHFSGTRAVFSMVVGAPVEQYGDDDARWQIYEVTGFDAGETVVITRLPGQPEAYNNVSPIYASDGDIIFTSDRPRNGAAHLYPQQDEYESTPTNTGLWRLDLATQSTTLLQHAPSGSFSPSLDSEGRVLMTRWDHLQRDQLADISAMGGTDYETFNYASEAEDALPTGNNIEVFPEPRRSWLDFIRDNPDYDGPLRGYADHLVGHRFERFQIWQINQDGTEEETLNHVGRHETAVYFTPVFNNDDSLSDFYFGSAGNGSIERVRNMFQAAESPLQPGLLYAVDAPTFFTHACGRIIALESSPSINPDAMQIFSVTHPDTAEASDDPGDDHSGLYRNPRELSDGQLIASHTAETRRDENEGTSGAPLSRYDLRLKIIDRSGEYAVPGPPLTAGNGIEKTVSYWNPYEFVSYSGPLWEIDAVEVVSRPTPPDPESTLEQPELDAIAAAGVSQTQLRAYLSANDLALIVARDVTQRDAIDRQQPFNLRVDGTSTQRIGDDGQIYDIAFMQMFQADQIRARGTSPGRRVLAQPMHDPAALLPPVASGAPESSVRIAEDGSVASLVPATRAMTWQITDDTGESVVRERYWLSFQSGEIRMCTSCHGANTVDQAGLPPATNSPQALTDLLVFLRDSGALAAPGDLDSDGDVDFVDLTNLLAAWASVGSPADLDANGSVGFTDLLILLNNWTPS